MTVILDAGPALTFLAVGQQNVLIQLATEAQASLAAPERVDAEVLGMCRHPRFARTNVKRTWEKLKSAERLTILSDDLSGAFAETIGRVSGMPAADRVLSKPSMGESW